MLKLMTPTFWLAVVLGAIAIFGSGYALGDKHASSACAADQAREQRAAQTRADEINTHREAVAQQRETSRQRVRVVYLKIKESADESVKNNPAGYDCVMDSNGLRAWNAANAGTAAPLSGEPDHRLLDAAIGEIGTSGRSAAEPHRGDGAVHAMPRPAQEAGGLREPAKVAQ